MCASLGTVSIPSHVSSQLVVFPAEVLSVFPVQTVQESPSLKYPTLQTANKEGSKISTMVFHFIDLSNNVRVGLFFEKIWISFYWFYEN